MRLPFTQRLVKLGYFLSILSHWSLVQWSLLISEIRGSDPVIGKFYLLSSVQTKIKKQRPGIANFLKKYLFLNAIQVFDSSYPVDKFWYESRDAVIDANLAKLVETHFLVKPHCGFLNICSWFILCRLRCQLWPIL